MARSQWMNHKMKKTELDAWIVLIVMLALPIVFLILVFDILLGL